MQLDLENRTVKFMIGGGLIFFILMICLIKYMEHFIMGEREKKPKQQAQAEPAKVEIKDEERQIFIPPQSVRPEDIGLATTPDSAAAFQAQSDWNDFVKDNIKPKVDSMPEEKQKIAEGFNHDPEELRKANLELDKKIEAFENQLKKNPYDKEAKERLEKLRILKALSENFKDDFTSQGNPPK